jgi:hypothetical protein
MYAAYSGEGETGPKGMCAVARAARIRRDVTLFDPGKVGRESLRVRLTRYAVYGATKRVEECRTLVRGQAKE